MLSILKSTNLQNNSENEEKVKQSIFNLLVENSQVLDQDKNINCCIEQTNKSASEEKERCANTSKSDVEAGSDCNGQLTLLYPL